MKYTINCLLLTLLLTGCSSNEMDASKSRSIAKDQPYKTINRASDEDILRVILNADNSRNGNKDLTYKYISGRILKKGTVPVKAMQRNIYNTNSVRAEKEIIKQTSRMQGIALSGVITDKGRIPAYIALINYEYRSKDISGVMRKYNPSMYFYYVYDPSSKKSTIVVRGSEYRHILAKFISDDDFIAQ